MKSKVKAKAPKEPVEWKPAVGDKVKYKTHQSIYEITRVSPDGAECDIAIPRTNFEIFRVPASKLTLNN